MSVRFYRSDDEFDAIYRKLKLTQCPHCKRVGTLNLHGFLRGYDEKSPRDRAVRAHRVYCNKRKRGGGCGRTFSVWAADKIRRLSLTADCLWKFIKRACSTGNKLRAFRSLETGLSDSAPYRIWKRFDNAQSKIRTALAGRCEAPNVKSGEPARQTVAHLKAAFPGERRPIVAFQAKLETFFL